MEISLWIEKPNNVPDMLGREAYLSVILIPVCIAPLTPNAAHKLGMYCGIN